MGLNVQKIQFGTFNKNVFLSAFEKNIKQTFLSIVRISLHQLSESIHVSVFLPRLFKALLRLQQKEEVQAVEQSHMTRQTETISRGAWVGLWGV